MIQTQTCLVEMYETCREYNYSCPHSILRDRIISTYDEIYLYFDQEMLAAIKQTSDPEVVALSVMMHALMDPQDGILTLADAVRIVHRYDPGVDHSYSLEEETGLEYGAPITIVAFVRMIMQRLPYGFLARRPLQPAGPEDDDVLRKFMRENDLPGEAACLRTDGEMLYRFEDLGTAIRAKLELGLPIDD